MWVFTKYGFFSAVCARKGDGKYGQPIDPDRIMIRARLRSHLDALLKRFPDVFGESEIQTFAGTDYAFRVFVAKPVWSNVLAALAEETDYDNFKSEVARHLGKDGMAYEKSLHDVWDVMYGLQRQVVVQACVQGFQSPSPAANAASRKKGNTSGSQRGE